ncbi:MAG: septum formation initiator family protein [Bacteroidia bacterium]|nr:septum formation initiator family protein [Bacteroidia bacterium]
MIVLKEQIVHFYQRLPWFVKNKYVISILFFLVWMFFFDQNDVLTQRSRAKQLKSLENQRDFYLSEIKKVKADKIALFSSDESIEKFAREKYYMKRENEDIYIIEN